MARGSSSSGSSREWEAARRAEQRGREQAARLEEQKRKARERERAQREASARDEDAAARTLAVEQRVEELEGLLRSSLAGDPRISFASLRRRVTVPHLDLGQDAVPIPSLQWADFEPEPERGLRRMFGGQQRYEVAVREAEEAFRQAQENDQHSEAQRRKRVAEATRAHGRKVAEIEREVNAHNAHIDEMEAGLRDKLRYAVSE